MFNHMGPITHLLLHSARSEGGIEISARGHDGGHHTLFLEVLIAFILAQLHNIVLALPPGFIQVDACTGAPNNNVQCSIFKVNYFEMCSNAHSFRAGLGSHVNPLNCRKLSKCLLFRLPFLILRALAAVPGLELIAQRI